MKAHVLVVDDDPSLCAVLDLELTQRQYRVTLVASQEEALQVVESKGDDVGAILTDLNLAGSSGVDFCARIVASGRDIPVLVMTAFGSLDSAIAAIRAGAYDYVTKPLNLDDLALTLDRALKERALRAEVRWLGRIQTDQHFEGMVGDSGEMKTAFELVGLVARSDATVLVSGESGSGKELVAKAIHARSARSKGPFIAINCAALPETLLESELFGHTKGAFTDARQSRRGLFVAAGGGTLFLDEIGEMPPGMQVKLLRALQERKVRPVGGDAEVEFDTRIIAATNRDLEAEVAAKRFREDLFYRLNVVHVPVPPLRNRGRDVLLLAKHMLVRSQPGGMRIVGFKPGVIDVFLSYRWPGNVRELQNCIEHAVALAEFDHIGVEDLPARVREGELAGALAAGNPAEPSELITVEELERRYIAYVLQVVGGNKTVAAKVLGFDRRTLYRKIDKRMLEGEVVEEGGEVAGEGEAVSAA